MQLFVNRKRQNFFFKKRTTKTVFLQSTCMFCNYFVCLLFIARLGDQYFTYITAHFRYIFFIIYVVCRYFSKAEDSAFNRKKLFY